MEKKIIVPHKFREAVLRSLEENKFTFISAGAGWGKSSCIQELLGSRHPYYVSIIPGKTPRFSIKEPLIVLDDYHNLSLNLEERMEKIFHKSPRRQKIVVLSRGPLAGYLLECHKRGTLRLLESRDISFDIESISALAGTFGLSLPADELVRIIDVTQGCPSLIRFSLEALSGGKRMGGISEEYTNLRIDRYLDDALYRSLEPDVCKLLLSTSFFEEFTPELAKLVTGVNWDANGLELLRRRGIPIISRMGCWGFTDNEFIRPYLKRKAEIELTQEEVRKIYISGGSWYENKEDFKKAVKYYLNGGSRKKAIEVLIKNIQKDAGLYNIYKFKEEYSGLSKDELLSSPELMYVKSRICSMSFDISGEKEWYSALKNYAKRTGSKETLGYLLLLGIGVSMPALKQFEEAYRLIESGEINFRPCSVTGGAPSILRCLYGLSAESYECMELSDSGIWQTVESILDRHGVGLAAILRTEWKLERGEDISELFLQWHKIKLQIRDQGTLDMEFVCVALMARYFCFIGQSKEASSILENFRSHANSCGEEQLMENIDAMRCRISLLEDSEYTIVWFSRHSISGQDFFLPDSYKLFTKVRCHMKREEYPAALLILGQMWDCFSLYPRPLEQIEVLILIAVCRFRTQGENWKEFFSQALELGARYGYTAVISREGAAVMPLFEQYSGKETDTNYWRRLFDQVARQSIHYPMYLKPLRYSMESLTPRETTILLLLLQNKTNDEISRILNIRSATVKSHLHNIFQKLDVRNRKQAKEVALRLRLEQ